MVTPVNFPSADILAIPYAWVPPLAGDAIETDGAVVYPEPWLVIVTFVTVPLVIAVVAAAP